MIIKTLNSEYIIKGKELWRNGELFTDDIQCINRVTGKTRIWYIGIPKVGDNLLVEYYDGTTMRAIRTSTVTEVVQ